MVKGQLSDAATASDDLAKLEEFITAARVLSRNINAILAEDGLREDSWRTMRALAARPGLLMGEIAEALIVSAATVTRLVNELANNGLAYRRPVDTDGRQARVYLSRTGHLRLARASALLTSRLGPVPQIP